VNSYNVWNYAEGHDSYYASILVDLTLPPDDVSYLFQAYDILCTIDRLSALEVSHIKRYINYLLTY